MARQSGTGDLRASALEAFERRAPDSVALLDAALRRDPHDGALLLADASARVEQGLDAPFARLVAILRQDPVWIGGQRTLAQLKIEFGHEEPLAEIERALSERPNDPRLWHCYLGLLAASDRPLEAADKTAELRRRVGEVPALCLLEARYAGLAGDPQRGARLLEGLPEQLPDLAYQQARNALQRGDAEAATRVIAKSDPGADARMWAMAEIAWRATGNERHEWLLPGDRLYGRHDLGLDTETLAALCDTLRGLHGSRAAPPSQSLRGGTQTRGNLHLRQDPAIQDFFVRVDAALADYSRQLAALDPAHPMAPLAGRPAQVVASWSIRLVDGGFHVPHMHDNGLLSSACHLVVPDGAERGEGLLELGRPPRDIAVEMAALESFAPLPGQLILFPSFLYHSTTPFAAAERLTAVFDAR